MKDNIISILSTRPIDSALIEKASYHNIQIDTVTFIEVKKLLTEEVKTFINTLSYQQATVVFTSMNAVEVLVDAIPKDAVMPDWKIYCLGGATFTLVKKYWPFNTIYATAKNATELAEEIMKDEIKEIIFFCGNKRREELPVLLSESGIDITEVTVYETIETPAKIESSYNGVLLFSPSAVESFFSANTVIDETTFFAIGNTTASAIKQFSKNNIIISDFPAKDQLVYKAINYFTGKMNTEN